MAKHLTEKLIALFSGLLALNFGKQLIVFLISMLPILELRGGLIAASLLKLPPWESYIIAMAGNLLPIPFILWTIKSLILKMQQSKLSVLNRGAEWLHKKVEKNKYGIEKYGFWGLVLFVGIPLPGTGAWTGTLIAAVLDIDKKKTILGVLLGLFLASIIMMTISFVLLRKLVQ